MCLLMYGDGGRASLVLSDLKKRGKTQIRNGGQSSGLLRQQL